MTTPLPPDPTHDDDLPGEAELRALYGRLPPSEPAPALDAAIRQAAAQAGQPTVQARRPRRWPIALGTAAAVVLATGLAWRMREMPARETSSPSAPAAAMEAARNEATRMPPGAGLASPPPRGTPAMKSVASEPAMAAGRASPANPPPPALALARRAPAPVAAPRMAERMAPASTPPAAPSPRGQIRASEADALGAARMAAPAAPAPPSAPAAFAPRFAPAPGSATIETSVASSPEVELDAIRVLYAKGKTVEADKRLRTFHDSHPDWPLPDDLRRHLDRTP